MNRDELKESLLQRTPRSGAAWDKALQLLPQGLISGARMFDPYPFYAQRADGAFIWDIDGNRYIDCCMGYGALLLGHRHPAVIEALTAQLERGTLFGTPSELEVAFAEKFVRCAPCVEKLMVCNSGTEATMQAIRLARAFTGRQRIAKFEGGYHGWHDYALWNSFSSGAPDFAAMGPAERPNLVPDTAGIPPAVRDTMLVLPYEEAAFELIEEHSSELAAVIIEPVLGGWSLPADRVFLEKLRKATREAGSLFIFDEVITGFRLALGGAQEIYGVVPDVATYGKAIGGGMPIGAVGASRAIMEAVTAGDDSIVVAGTFSGNPMSLAAGNAVLDYLIGSPQVYAELADKGDRLVEAVNGFAQAKGLPAAMTGMGSMVQLHLTAPPIDRPRDTMYQDYDALKDFQLLLCLNGVFVPRVHIAFLSPVHSDEHLEQVINAHQVALEACFEVQDATRTQR
jgi:glutamate-1-semialdehyde 2,1-aminomutase